MNAVMIIPTGIGCEIGGHAGDATPAARLLASVCDTLILHPNVVNASDINEMPINSWYVEGSMLDRFLEGGIELQSVRSNRILVAVNHPVHTYTVNAVSAARAAMGVDASIVELNTPLKLIGRMENKIATGDVYGWEELVKQVSEYDFDALAIATMIDVGDDVEMNYFKHGGTNPWGGVEAKASKLICKALGKPVAHAPVDDEVVDNNDYNFVCEPRIAAELLSWTYLHCVLKGLHKAPRIGKGLSIEDIDCLITPVDCVGRPHRACMAKGIPIIAVKENTNCLNDSMPDKFILVENYLEAAGLIAAMEAGVNPENIRRPLKPTEILNA